MNSKLKDPSKFVLITLMCSIIVLFSNSETVNNNTVNVIGVTIMIFSGFSLGITLILFDFNMIKIFKQQNRRIDEQ